MVERALFDARGVSVACDSVGLANRGLHLLEGAVVRDPVTALGAEQRSVLVVAARSLADMRMVVA